MAKLRIRLIITPMNRNEIVLLSEVREASRTGDAAAIRTRAALSQRDIARAIAVSPASVNRWEAGTRKPTGDAALRYGRLLRVLREREAA